MEILPSSDAALQEEGMNLIDHSNGLLTARACRNSAECVAAKKIFFSSPIYVSREKLRKRMASRKGGQNHKHRFSKYVVLPSHGPLTSGLDRNPLIIGAVTGPRVRRTRRSSRRLRACVAPRNDQLHGSDRDS
jgi:hypothetical protein